MDKLSESKNTYIKFIIDSLSAIFGNSRKALANIKEKISEDEQSHLSDFKSYLLLGLKLLSKSSDAVLEFKYFLTYANKNLKIFVPDNNEFVNIANFQKIKPLSSRTNKYPNGIDKLNRSKYFILLVNLLAVYDYENTTNTVNYTFLLKLMFALFGDWFYNELIYESQNSKEFIRKLNEIKNEYIDVKGKKDSTNWTSSILKFVYGNMMDSGSSKISAEFEQVLFESYSKLYSSQLPLIKWLLEIEESCDYIDVKPLVVALQSSSVPNDVHLKIHRIEITNSCSIGNNPLIDEGYYEKLTAIFDETIEISNGNQTLDLPDNLSDKCYL